MERVTGIGGIFFKARDPERLSAWYQEHLGIATEDGHADFFWREHEHPDQVGRTVWSVFPAEFDYFGAGSSPFMVNCRVANLDRMLEQLRGAGIVVEKVEDYDYGRFAWFEHDLYDQLQLLQILDWFAHQDTGRTKLTMICTAEYLGMSTVERLRERNPERQPVSKAQLELARAAWSAFRSPDPTHLTGLHQQGTSALPFLADALWRHLQQFPSKRNGLSRSEHQALEVIASGVITLGRVYRAFHHDREEATFLGDATFAHYFEGLSAGRAPLVLWESGRIIKAPRGRDHSPEFWKGEVMLTPTGRAVLEGAADQVRVNGIDRWLGGVRLSGREAEYRWDETARRLVCNS